MYSYGRQCDMCQAKSELLEGRKSVHAVVCHNCFSLEVHASFCTEATSSYSKLLVGNSLPVHYYANGEVFYRMIRFVQALSSCCSFCWLKRSLPASHKYLQICQVSGLCLLCDCLGSSRARLVVNSMIMPGHCLVIARLFFLWLNWARATEDLNRGDKGGRSPFSPYLSSHSQCCLGMCDQNIHK